MIRYALNCEHGHTLESWFQNSAAYDKQANAAGARQCAGRGDVQGAREHITKNADYVGPRFPEHARKIHYGEIEHRLISGEASPDEAEELHEEGIAFQPLPILPDEFN